MQPTVGGHGGAAAQAQHRAQAQHTPTVHAAAALKHHYFDRDATLSRMLPGLPPPSAADTNKDA